jgi:hypothetical protein
MAQTKRKRRTKHRGTPAGTIETRGRTGRKPTADERKAKPGSKEAQAQRREARFNAPPTWRGAAQRAAIATIILVALLILAFKQDPARAIALGGFAMIVYVPMGFYTDLYMYRRRQQKKLVAAKPKPKEDD